MANKTISDLRELSTVSDNNVLVVETNAETFKVTKENLLKEVNEEVNTKSNINHTHDEYVTESELNAKGLATETFVTNKIAEASLSGGDVDLSAYATIEFVNQEIKEIELTPGPQGPKGDTGAVGPQGPKGEKGEPGTTSWNDLEDKPNLNDYVLVENFNQEIDKTNAQLSQNTQNLKSLKINIKDYEHEVIDGDWTPIIQKIIDEATSGCIIFFPNGVYNLNSTHPTETDCQILINKYRITFESDTIATEIRCNYSGSGLDSMIKVKYDSTITGLAFKTISLNGQNLCNYVFHSPDTWLSELYINGVRMYKSKEAVFKASMFVSSINNSWFKQSKVGVHLPILDETRSTSTTLTSVFTSDCTDSGYIIDGTYCNLVSCASDRNNIGYNMRNCRGVTMIGCGAEYTKVLVKSYSWRGGHIDTFYTLNCGDESQTEDDALFDFGSVVDLMINGIHHAGIKGSAKQLSISESSYGSENITVLDNSIKPSQAKYVENWGFKKPIKFIRGDETTKDLSTSVSSHDELQDYINSLPPTINNVVTITLTSDIDMTDKKLYITGFNGTGHIIFEGNYSEGNYSFNNISLWKPILIENNTIPIYFKDISFINTFNHNNQEIVRFSNAKGLFENCLFSNEMTKCGSAVSGHIGSNIVLSSDCSETGTFGSDGFFNVWHEDATSLVTKKD